MSAPTFVIAEPGSCHDGRCEGLLQLADLAAEAGADAFKVQYWSSAERLAERRRAPAYRTLYEHYRMPVEWFEPVAEFCRGRGLELLATCYLPEDVATVAPYVSRFKIASFEV